MRHRKTLSGQALKVVFTLNKYLYNFTALTPSHKLELFDKLVSPILNFGSEVWGFYKSPSIETVHLQFCKKILGVKQSTQNDFVYGELGRIYNQSRRYLAIIKYWFKVVSCDENKYRRLSLTRLCLTRYYHLRRSDSPVPTFFPIYLLQFDYA